MWEFKAQQKQLVIGDVKIGGLPGSRPTVLIGSIFYNKHRIVKNQETGEFDREEAERVINEQEEFSNKTGNQSMLDVVGSTPVAMEKFLEFVSSVTDAPILLDGVSEEVRLKGLDYVNKAGIKNPIVYNSLVPESRLEEYEKIKEYRLKNAVLLAFNRKEFTSKGRVDAIKQILPRAKDAGVENILIDTCVLDIPSLGVACKALFDLKNEFGFPVGCGAHNAIATWTGLRVKMGDQAIHPAMASANALAVAAGADFILYGPIEEAKYVFPAVALIDAAYGQLIREHGEKLDKTHPIYRIA
ncbi:MAG: tetrahydromethanopterin S-methyltransferase subunit H [Candidatus Bathyarchaeia archaeon]|nr:tetrahydromethanopterin S-methyltransferase subunit H [Candidatus Bathyarchaeota archaeon]